MKIIASNKDDILRRKAEYDADFNRRKLEYNKQRQSYLNDMKIRADQLVDEVRAALPDTKLDLNIYAEPNYTSLTDMTYQITIRDENNLSNSNKPLSWSWSVMLNEDGDVIKESNSWSGLNATTAENISILKDIVNVLQALNDIEWKSILSKVPVPNYAEYVTETDPKYDSNKPNFDRELLEADIDDIIGKNVGVLTTDGKYYKGNVYRLIVSESSAQFNVYEIPEYKIDQSKDIAEISLSAYKDYTYKIRKSTLYDRVIQPVKFINF